MHHHRAFVIMKICRVGLKLKIRQGSNKKNKVIGLAGGMCIWNCWFRGSEKITKVKFVLGIASERLRTTAFIITLSYPFLSCTYTYQSLKWAKSTNFDNIKIFAIVSLIYACFKTHFCQNLPTCFCR